MAHPPVQCTPEIALGHVRIKMTTPLATMDAQSLEGSPGSRNGQRPLIFSRIGYG
jgi:hypothetical protein